MVWNVVNFVPIVGPIVSTIGMFISKPVSMLTCWVAAQPDYIVNAVCVALSNTPCK